MLLSTFNWIESPEAWVALLTLTGLEIVLGIDNIIFISIMAAKLPKDEQNRARLVGLGLAMFTRIGLLFSLALIMRLTAPIFHLFDHGVSGRDLILIVGGLFLIAKSTHEIHSKLEGETEGEVNRSAPSFISVIVQIIILDIVFSLDSVITAIGMANHLTIMILAVVIAVGFMMVFSASISSYVQRHPTIKMLALSFLLLIGVTLMADGFGQHISKGYIYSAMAFSVFVEMLNLRIRARSKPVVLHEPLYATEKPFEPIPENGRAANVVAPGQKKTTETTAG